jgi:L-threonylcarbamoyladenylate synthase
MTKILEPTPENIALAAEALQAGKLVILPTETVYGIAGLASNEIAIQAIFEAKGRPANNPLIAHVGYLRDAKALAAEWSPLANRLAAWHWPGALTLVVRKSPGVSDMMTAGGDTVAVRMPSHPVIRELTRLVGPLAAPSANLFTRLSPTRVEMLDPALIAKVEYVIDGGPCDVGLESTVLDITGQSPVLLRPGGVAVEQIEEVLEIEILRSGGNESRSPGTHPVHYSPRKPVVIVEKLAPNQAGITFEEPQNELQVQLPAEAKEYARDLYAALHWLDESEAETIAVEAIPEAPEWDAIRDRLRRATASSTS